MAEDRSILDRILGRGGNETVKNFPDEMLPNWDNSPYTRGASQIDNNGKRSVKQLRRWARENPWIRAAINLRRTQVSRAQWDIVSLDGETPVDHLTVKRIKYLFRHPNTRRDSFRSFIEPVIEDLLTLDIGAIEVEPTAGARLGIRRDPIANLWPIDGGSIRFDPSWDGTDSDKPRYYQYDSSGKVVSKYLNDELVVIQANPMTYSPLGLSPLEVLASTIDSDMAAAQYNSRSVTQAAPPGILHLGEGIRPDQVDAFKSYWDAEIAGRSQVAITGGGKQMQWIPLAPSNRDMQFMEWQIYLARKICAVFGVQPQDIGITMDVNRASAEVGAAFTQDVGITPLLDLIAEYLTREIVWRYDENLRFTYTDLGRASKEVITPYYRAALAGMPWLRLNDALRERGQDGVGKIGDEIWLPTPRGFLPLSLYARELGIVDGDGNTTPPDSPVGAPEGGDDDTQETPAQPADEPTPPAIAMPTDSTMPGEEKGAEQKLPPKPPARRSKPSMPPKPPMKKNHPGKRSAAVLVDPIGTIMTPGFEILEGGFDIIEDFEEGEDEGAEIYIMTNVQKEDLGPMMKALDDNQVVITNVFILPVEDNAEAKLELIEELHEEFEKIYVLDANEDVDYTAAKVVILSAKEDAEEDGEAETEKSERPINLKAPRAVKAEAKRGLDWRKEFGRGGIGPGQTTARMLINDTMTIARARKMRAWHARHAVDRKGQGYRPGEAGYPSAGRIANALWGGVPGERWANKVMRQVEARERKR